MVADGCTDNTADIVEAFKGTLQIYLIEQPAQGQAMARNVGALKSTGKLLVFLDDDIEPQPLFLAAHIRSHSERGTTVVIGYYPPLLITQTGYFRTELLDWWEIIFQNMRQPGYRFSYTDLVSGNFSLHAEFFEKVGGFNSGLRCHEDYELGIRLLQAGAEFVHSIEALGYHHERSKLPQALKRKYDEGIADVQIGRLYPFLRSTLLMDKLQKHSLPPSRVLKIFAFHWQTFGDLIADIIRKRMDFFERIRWHKMWLRFLNGLMGYWYWRGVAIELPNLTKVRNFLNDPAAQSEARSIVEINLAEGIATSELIIDECRPDEVRLSINQAELGRIPFRPGKERLRGAHLRPHLVNKLSLELIKTLAEEPSFPYPEISAELVAKCEESLKLKKKWSSK